MKRKTMSTILHIILVFCAIGIILFFFAFLPFVGSEFAQTEPDYHWCFWPCLIWAWVFSIPFFVSLFPAWGIFSSIRQEGGAFCKENAKRFRLISYMAWSAFLIFVTGMIVMAVNGAGSPVLTLIVTPTVMFIGISMGFICYVMSRLVMDSAQLKHENDLTI